MGMNKATPVLALMVATGLVGTAVAGYPGAQRTSFADKPQSSGFDKGNILDTAVVTEGYTYFGTGPNVIADGADTTTPWVDEENNNPTADAGKVFIGTDSKLTDNINIKTLWLFEPFASGNTTFQMQDALVEKQMGRVKTSVGTGLLPVVYEGESDHGSYRRQSFASGVNQDTTLTDARGAAVSGDQTNMVKMSGVNNDFLRTRHVSVGGDVYKGIRGVVSVFKGASAKSWQLTGAQDVADFNGVGFALQGRKAINDKVGAMMHIGYADQVACRDQKSATVTDANTVDTVRCNYLNMHSSVAIAQSKLPETVMVDLDGVISKRNGPSPTAQTDGVSADKNEAVALHVSSKFSQKNFDKPFTWSVGYVDASGGNMPYSNTISAMVSYPYAQHAKLKADVSHNKANLGFFDNNGNQGTVDGWFNQVNLGVEYGF
jgi:hypothetical protein